MKRAVYSGTFDPITRGHEDIVRRVSGLFDEVIVAVAASQRKQPLFDLPARVQLAKNVLADYQNVRVLGFDGLLCDFVHAQDACAIVRGIRNVTDFDYEFNMAGINRQLCPDVETIFITPAEPYLFVSASMVREIAAFGGEVRSYVHPLVYAALTNIFPPQP